MRGQFLIRAIRSLAAGLLALGFVLVPGGSAGAAPTGPATVEFVFDAFSPWIAVHPPGTCAPSVQSATSVPPT